MDDFVYGTVRCLLTMQLPLKNGCFKTGLFLPLSEIMHISFRNWTKEAQTYAFYQAKPNNNELMNSIYPKDYISGYYKTMHGNCFIIMPFAKEFTEIFDVIREAIQNLNFICIRGDELSEQNILKSIIENIATSELIIADLSGQNANVFYELGIAHCFKNSNQVVLLTQKIEDIPFDLRHFRCIVYSQNITGGKKLYHDLQKLITVLIGETFHLRIPSNGERIKLPHRIKGDSNFLYELDFFCTYSSKMSSKIGVEFTLHLYNGRENKIRDVQGVTFDKNYPSTKLDNIPWFARMIRMDDAALEIIIQKL